MSNTKNTTTTNGTQDCFHLEFEERGKKILEEARKIVDLAIKENEKLKEEVEKGNHYDYDKVSKTTLFLKGCYDEIGYRNINQSKLALYYASRFFALFGFNDNDSRHFALKALDNLLQKNDARKSPRLFTDLFDYDDDIDYFVFKFSFKDYLESSYEVLCEIVPYKNYCYVKNEFIEIFLSQTFSNVQKIINSKKFIDSFLSIKYPHDAFFYFDVYDVKDDENTQNALEQASKLLFSFSHLVRAVSLGAPELIVKNDLNRFFRKALVLAFYDKVNYREVDLEDAGKALQFRLKRLVDKYVPLAKFWSRDFELKALHDLVSIIADPYAYHEQISEPFDEGDEEDNNSKE